MAMLRMNMGQKHAAKNMTKVAFGERSSTKTNGSTTSAAQKAATSPAGAANGDPTSPRTEGVVSPGSSSKIAQKVAFAESPNPDIQAPGIPCGDVQDGAVKTVGSNGGEGTTECAVEIIEDRPRRPSHRRSSILDIDQQVPKYQQHFNLAMGALIILNTFLIAIETDVGSESGKLEDRVGWLLIDSFFLIVFIMEIVVRMKWEGLNEWAHSAWNWVDVSIVLFAIVDIWILAMVSGDPGSLDFISIFRIVRLVRLVRLVKLVRLLQGLYLILMAFWHAMQTMSFLLAMMMFGLMVYSIFAVNLIGRNPQIRDVQIHDDTAYDRFGTVYASMYSLFELLTLEGWEQVARPIVEAQPLIFFFIVSFIMIFTFGMLNMVVALVIDKTLHHSRLLGEQNALTERMNMVEELYRMHERYTGTDAKDGRAISAEEFQAILSDSVIITLLDRMGIREHEARDLYMVLDWDHSGELDIDEVVEGLSKLQDNVLCAWDAMATHSYARSTRFMVKSLEESMSRMAKEQERLQTSFADQQRRLGRIESSIEMNAETLQSILSTLRGLQLGCGSQ